MVSCTKADPKAADAAHGFHYIFTAICCFSRYAWLAPLRNKNENSVGKVLLEKVLLDGAMFPVVLRSDNAREFTGSVISYINNQLEIRHVLGSTYHPQSQGVVERMHRTMKAIGKALAEGHPADWPEMLPYAQCVLRILPLKSLGGRSPYEVVTGLKPKLPSAMLVKYPVQEITVDSYAEQLVEHLRSLYHRLRALMQDVVDQNEQEAEGSLGQALRPGDLVLRRYSPHEKQKEAGAGPWRFTRSVDPRFYRVVRAVADQPFAYYVVDHAEPSRQLKFKQPLNRRLLIKLDMPELREDSLREKRRIELQTDEGHPWQRGTVEGLGVDGRAKIRWDHHPAGTEQVELCDRRFRWLYGEPVRDWDVVPEFPGE